MKLLWLDLETEGLNPRECHILEVYAAIADLSNPFEIEKEIGNFVIGRGFHIGDGLPCFGLAEHADQWSEYVREMHTKNGLIADMKSSTLDVEQVESMILPHVPASADKDDITTLAGSSIHFDQSFINVHMPRLAKRLHYRVFDVSTIKLLARAYGREKWPRAEAHRARADVYESIQHGRDASNYIASQNSLWRESTSSGIVDVSKNPGAVKA